MVPIAAAKLVISSHHRKSLNNEYQNDLKMKCVLVISQANGNHPITRGF